MGLGRKQGEDVRISLTSTDASGGVKVVVLDANGVDRPIQSYERLILDSLQATVLTTTTLAVNDPGTGVSTDGVLMLEFELNSGEWHTDGEGMAVSVGSTPVAKASASGNVTLTGTGRVVSGGTRGVRAGYKELLTPGGNVNGQ